jgi:hypothetical protein
VFGDGQAGPAGGTGDPGGDVQQPVAQCLRLGAGEVAVQEQGPGPGEQVDAGQGELQPGLVDREDPVPAENVIRAGQAACSYS